MHTKYHKFFILMCCFVLASCASGSYLKTIDGVLEFRRTIQENQNGILSGMLDTRFIGENGQDVNANYTLFLTLQKLGNYSSQDDIEKNKVTVMLTYPFNNMFSIALPPGNYYPLIWQCNSTYRKNNTVFNQTVTWPDFSSKSQLQSKEMGKDRAPIKDPFPQSPILIERGKFTYIGKIKLRLPVSNTPIKVYIDYLKNTIKDSAELETSLKYGMKFDSAVLPIGLNTSSQSGPFVYTYVSNSSEEYQYGIKEIFATNIPVIEKMLSDDKTFKISLIRGVGLMYKDVK